MKLDSFEGHDLEITSAQADAIVAIIGEREYQNERWKQRQRGVKPTVGEYLPIIRTYLQHAETVFATTPSPESEENVLRILRKVAALCVKAMEDHGAYDREKDPPELALSKPNF